MQLSEKRMHRGKDRGAFQPPMEAVHFPYKNQAFLVGYLEEGERLGSTPWPRNNSGQLRRWISMLTYRIKTQMEFKTLRKIIEGKGILFECYPSFFFYFWFKWNKKYSPFPILCWFQQQVQYVTVQWQFVQQQTYNCSSLEHRCPLVIFFWLDRQHDNFLEIIHSYFIKTIVHLLCR